MNRVQRSHSVTRPTFRSASRARVWLAYLLCCALWGSTWPGVKVALVDLPPFRLGAVRLALACALLAPFALRPSPKLSRRAWLGLLAFGAVNSGIGLALLFAGQRLIPSGLAAVFFATFPILVAVLGALLPPRSALQPRHLIAGLLGMTGVAIIQLPTATLSWQRASLVGGALVLAAAVLIAVANVLLKRYLPDAPTGAAAWIQLAGGMAVLALLSLLLETGKPWTFSARSLGALVYLAAFGSVGTNLLYFWLLPRLPLAALGAIPLLDTVVAVALGAALLGEPLSWRFALGAALVLGAAALSHRESGRAAPAPDHFCRGKCSPGEQIAPQVRT